MYYSYTAVAVALSYFNSERLYLSGCLNCVRGYFAVNARLAAHHAFRLLARNGAFFVNTVGRILESDIFM